MKEHLPVFVYGTLREGEANAGLLDGHVAARTPATLPGHRLHLLEYPCVVEHRNPTFRHPKSAPEGAFAGPERRPGPAVRGEVVVLDVVSYDAAIERLDWLEGFDPGDVAGSLYVRVIAIVATADGARECWVYVAGAALRRRLDSTNLIASGDWLDR